MAVSSLKGVLVKHKTDHTGVIKRLLHAHIGGYEKPRSKKTIHASELTNSEREFCPRAYRLHDEYEVKDPARHVDTSLEYTFAEGRFKQKLLNEVWLRDKMVGCWRCTLCKKTLEFGTHAEAMSKFSDPSHTCVLEYDEVRVLDPVAGHSGGIDALVAVKVGAKLRLVECKIMDKDMFKALKGPLAEHKTRTQLYLSTVARSKQPWASQIDTSEASVLYMMRGFGMKDENAEMSPFREYTIKRDDAAVAEYVARAHAVTASRKTPALGYPCGLCKSMAAPRAQQCPMVKQCFSSKHPATITWTRDGKPVHETVNVQYKADGIKLHII